MQALLGWIRHHSSTAIGLVTGALITSVINKVVESNDLEWLKAIWTAIAGFFVWVFDWFLSSAPVPIWLLLPVVSLALVPVWQLVKRIRLTSPAPAAGGVSLTRQQLMVLRTVQLADQVRRYNATVASVAEHTTLSPLEVDAAFDTLTDFDFVSRSHPVHGEHCYAVRPAGRAYLLKEADPASAQPI